LFTLAACGNSGVMQIGDKPCTADDGVDCHGRSQPTAPVTPGCGLSDPDNRGEIDCDDSRCAARPSCLDPSGAALNCADDCDAPGCEGQEHCKQTSVPAGACSEYQDAGLTVLVNAHCGALDGVKGLQVDNSVSVSNTCLSRSGASCGAGMVRTVFSGTDAIGEQLSFDHAKPSAPWSCSAKPLRSCPVCGANRVESTRITSLAQNSCQSAAQVGGLLVDNRVKVQTECVSKTEQTVCKSGELLTKFSGDKQGSVVLDILQSVGACMGRPPGCPAGKQLFFDPTKLASPWRCAAAPENQCSTLLIKYGGSYECKRLCVDTPKLCGNGEVVGFNHLTEQWECAKGCHEFPNYDPHTLANGTKLCIPC
jgi:hypothetical protein